MKKNPEIENQIRAHTFEKAKAEFTGWSEKKLITEILNLRKKIKELETDIASLKKLKEDLSQLNTKTYNQKWPYTKKIHYLLLKEQKPLSSSQLYSLLFKTDNHFEDYRDPATVLNTYLRRMTKSKRIIGHKLPGIYKFYYCLPEWMESENTLKAEFLQQIDTLD